MDVETDAVAGPVDERISPTGIRNDRPADVYFARGTINTHPYLMEAMHEFLTRLDAPETAAL